MKNHPIFKQICIFNKTITDLMAKGNSISIVSYATDKSVEIFKADYGVAMGQFTQQKKNEIVYKTIGSPKKFTPCKTSNSNCLLIPVHYADHAYGTIALGYKKKHTLTAEELSFTETMGNIIAQIFTVNWLVAEQRKTHEIAEKQKEMESLLSQEKFKTEFIANAAHEIRTPLAIMKGNVDLALASKLDTKSCHDAFMEINSEITRLSQILGDLELIVSGDQNQKLQTLHKPVNVVKLVTNVVMRLKALAQKSNITILLKIDRTKKYIICGEEKYLEKLFLNLIKNAITYGKDGGKIYVEICENRKRVEIQVKDNGIGISAEDLPKIFDRFYRGDKAHTGGNNHSGLGLAIVKWVVDSHRGQIKVKSTLEKGSTFNVFFPLL